MVNGAGLCEEEVTLLCELVRCRTVTPLESCEPPRIRAAQRLYAGYARKLGMEVVLHAPPPAGALEGPQVPLPVRRAAARMGDEYLRCQPNLVLRLGPARELARTLAINTHIDTVGGGPQLRREGERIWGRGAVDMKGPAVAVLAALRRAREARPDLGERTTVLLHSVAGEEGGAMGIHGTRAVLDAGFAGRLTIFAEPTDGRFFDHCTASMTACIEVRGEGATDDDPPAGHNATILLGGLASHMARALDRPVARLGGKLCIAGLSTGERHDRVYGSGRLQLNLAYPTAAAGECLGTLVELAFHEGLVAFARAHRSSAVAARTAEDARLVCRLSWSKRGLPTLANRDPHWEERLRAVGAMRLPDARAGEAFTCDAIWGGRAGGYSVVFGPGHLVRNGAHTDREHVDLADLARYAETLARVVLTFDDSLVRADT
jgi:acetylornithine deacetylase/succinyl-diaminopimelate desuccinylase-like protein